MKARAERLNQMQYHPHLHVIMPGLALSADGLRVRRAKGKRWLFPVKALGAAFRNRVRQLMAARDREQATQHLASLDAKVWRQAWVIDAQGVGRGQTAVRYLARYVNKTAISEPRLLGYDEAGHLRLNCQDSRSRRWHVVTLSVEEFLRRWCLHVLPKGLVRVRHYGFLSAAAKKKRERLHQILGTQAAPRPQPIPPAAPKCPCCGKPMTLLRVIQRPRRGRSGEACPAGPKGSSRAPPPPASG